MMNIDFMLKNIKRWIDIIIKEGYKITGYGKKVFNQIYINFEKEDKENENIKRI